MRAYAAHGLDQNASLDHQWICSDLKQFIAFQVLKPTYTNLNPYRFLDYYDVGDHEDFTGRQNTTQKIIDNLLGLFDEPHAPTVLRIQGESGCGKSSLMRAGVVAKLTRDPKYRERYCAVICRPTDFHGQDGRPKDVLKRFLRLVSLQTKLKFDQSDYDEIDAARFRAPQKAVEILESKLEKLKQTGDLSARLIVGLDQFEEIVDDLASEHFAQPWQDLIEFVNASQHSSKIGTVFTLESSRRTVIQKIELLSAFSKCRFFEIDGSSPEFVREIVELPFQRAGFRLEEKIVSELGEKFQRLSQDGEGRRYQGSILPLLALCLSNIYDRVHAIRGDAVKTEGHLHQDFNTLGEQQHNRNRVQHQEIETELNLERGLADLAESTWRTGLERLHQQDSNETLHHFLLMFVRFVSPAADNIVLESFGTPPYEDERVIAASFLSSRLLVRDNGRFRLVHEAVIRYWPKAAAWCERQRVFLKTKANFMSRAIVWADEGRPKSVDRVNQKLMDNAAWIMSTHLRTWSLNSDSGLHDEAALLYDYCKFIFSKSKTPRQKVIDSSKTHTHIAAQNGMIDLLDKFHKLDPGCLNVSTDQGLTVAHVAAWSQARVVDYLISKKVDVLKCDQNGWRPLVAPIKMGRRDIFDKLLPEYLPEHMQCPGGQNLLHVCGGSNQDIMAEALIRTHGLNPAQKDSEGWLPLHCAAYYGHVTTFKFFSTRSDITAKTNQGDTALHLAAQEGNWSVVDYLLENHSFATHIDDENGGGMTALMLAAMNRRPKVVGLLSSFCDPNRPCERKGKHEGCTALHFAILGRPDKKLDRAGKADALDTVHSLLAHPEINLNVSMQDGRTPFACAAELPYVRKVLLSDSRFDVVSPLSDGRTPLMFALQSGERSIVDRILHNPEVRLDDVSKDGTTPAALMISQHMGDLFIRALTDKRFDPWDQRFVVPGLLAKAISADQPKIVEALLEVLPKAGAETRRYWLSIALTSAMSTRYGQNLTARLLELGADPNTTIQKNGHTVLFNAAIFGAREAFEVILKHPLTNPEICDNWGRSPAEVAPEILGFELQALLTTARANRAETWNALSNIAERLAPEIAIKTTGSKTKSALALAVIRGDILSIQSLLQNSSINPQSVDQWGRTLTDLAPDHLRDEIHALLKGVEHNTRKGDTLDTVSP